MASKSNRRADSSASRRRNQRSRTRQDETSKRDARSREADPEKTGTSRRVAMPQSSRSRNSRGKERQNAPASDRRIASSGVGRLDRRRSRGSNKNWEARRKADYKRSEKFDSSRGKKIVTGKSAGATRLLVVLIIVAVFGLGGALLYLSGAFPVKEVQVMGSQHLSQEDVAKIAAVPEGSTMLRVSVSDIKKRLESSPWIRSASVSRQLPDTLQITITERTMAATVEITSTKDKQSERWAIDEDGVWLMEIPDEGTEAAENVPSSVYADLERTFTISDVPYGAAPVAGAKCTDKPVLNALKIVNGLSTSLANQITKIAATDDHNTTITLEDGIEISFGDAEDIRAKERVCLELMEEYPGQMVYINVRVVDRPTWRYY